MHLFLIELTKIKISTQLTRLSNKLKIKLKRRRIQKYKNSTAFLHAIKIVDLLHKEYFLFSRDREKKFLYWQ